MTSAAAATQPDVANIILEQLGGANRFTVMTGARDFLNLGDGLSFSIGRNAKKVNRIEIRLDAGTDTYTVRLLNINVRRAEAVQIIDEHEGVYFDQLVGLIERGTGMYLSL